MSRPIEFKKSVAVQISGLDVCSKKLQELVGRGKPAGQHHMRYTPADMRAVWFRSQGLDVPDSKQLSVTQPARLPPVIVTRMTKGGVGKTSLTVNVAASLAMMGYRVLVIDTDPQASATNLLGVETSAYNNKLTHIGDFLKLSTSQPDENLPATIRHIYDGGFLDLIPADITLAESDASLVAAMCSHSRADLFFTRNAAFLGQNYDAIIVDTAPGTTPIGLAFTYAARHAGKLLTVVELEGSCLCALDSLSSNLEEVKALTNAVVGLEVVINKYHPSLTHLRDTMSFLYAKYASMLNTTIIPQYSGFARQINPSRKRPAPLVELEPSSIGSRAIFDVTKSLIQSFDIRMA